MTIIKNRLEFKNKGEPLMCKADTKLKDAIKQMSEKNFGSILVVNDDKRPVGIVSERDILNRALAKGIDIENTKVSDIMTDNIYVAKEDDDLIHWLRLMSNERFRHLPVVDENGKVVCMMSQGDFVSYTWPQLMNQLKETARASIAPNYQLALIIAGLILYAVIVPVLFNLFS